MRYIDVFFMSYNKKYITEINVKIQITIKNT